MKITQTERKHWVNGHQVRGGWFHTFNMNIFSLGIMFSWGRVFKVEFFNLTK